LAAHHEAAGNAAGVVDAREALVALGPTDRAEALYQLAVALHRAGDNAAARRTVLQALEIAPNYEAAQMLLLEVRRCSAGWWPSHSSSPCRPRARWSMRAPPSDRRPSSDRSAGRTTRSMTARSSSRA